MLRTLRNQKYCGWCGSEVVFTSNQMSQCSSCMFKNYLNPKPCCNIIVSHNDKVLMVRRAIEPNSGKFDLPGGFMDITDDSIEHTAWRELEEEVGLAKSMVSQLIYYGSAMSPYVWQKTYLDNICFFFICKLEVGIDSIRVDKLENSDSKWVGKDDLPNIDFAWDIDRKMLFRYFGDRK